MTSDLRVETVRDSSYLLYLSAFISPVLEPSLQGLISSHTKSKQRTLLAQLDLPLKSSNRAYYNSKKQDVHGYIGFWAVMHQIPLVYYYPFCTFPRLNWNLQRLTKCNGIAFFTIQSCCDKWQAVDVCLKKMLTKNELCCMESSHWLRLKWYTYPKNVRAKVAMDLT